MPGSIKYFRRRLSTPILVSGDPYWNMVTLSLRTKTGVTTGAQNNTFIDSSSNNFTITRTGNVTQGNKSPYATGGGSMYFDGNGDYLALSTTSGALAFGPGDYTIEMWIYPTVLTGWQAIIGSVYSIAGYGIELFNDIVYVYTGTTNNVISAGKVKANVWQHLAIVRSGTSTTGYFNGVAQNTVTLTNNITDLRCVIGVNPGLSSEYFSGYISDLRVISGTALYTSSFTPPTSLLPVITNTKLLLSGTNGGIVDVSGNIDGETVSTVQASSAVTKFGTTAMKFNGSSDYLKFPASQNFVFGTGDFTIEFWFNATTLTTTQTWVINSWISPYPFGVDIANNAIRLNLNGSVIISASVSMSAGTWYHVAAVRAGGLARIFLNGAQVGSTTANATNVTGSQLVLVGVKADDLSGQFAGYLDDVRVTKGIGRYLTNFTPSTSYSGTAVDTSNGDPYYNNVILHLRGDGPNASTNIVDQKKKVATLVGNTQISTAQSKFGGSSIFFDGTGDYISFPASTDYTIGTSDFTVEMWFRPTNITASQVYLFGTNGSVRDLQLRLNSTAMDTVINGTTSVAASSLTFSNNVWYHVAFVRYNSTAMLFLNGTLIGSMANSANISAGSSTLYLGCRSDTQAANFTGYIDEFRFTSGIARYTSAFSVATSAFPEYLQLTSDPYLAQSVLLKNSGTSVIDATGKVSVTLNGDAKVDTANRKFVNSVRVDGTGDYMSIPNNTAFDFGSGNFTIELWVNFATISSTVTLISKRLNNTTFDAFVIRGTSFYSSSNGSSWDIANNVSIGTIPPNVWTHVAISRQGSSFRGFINGVQTLFVTSSAALLSTSSDLVIGSETNGQGATGFIEDVRLTKGIARYVGNFTVPLASFPII